MTTNNELIEKAKSVAILKEVSEDVKIGEVGCALETVNGNTYTGVSIHACCGIGFCAEHSAIAAMVTNQEYRIKTIVAVDIEGIPGPPCGRCREMMYQIDPKNLDTEVIIEEGKTVKLRELLPHRWQEE